MGIQIKEIRQPGRIWWREDIIVSFDNVIPNMTFEEIKQRFTDISLEVGEVDKKEFNTVGVYSVKDYYYHEFSIEFIDINDPSINKSDIKFIDSLFDRFCDNAGIFNTGFIILINTSGLKYNETLKRLKDEIIYMCSKL